MKIPEKSFFKIGEVAKLLDVEAYVLRYWESEFDMLVPEKTKSGQRIYQREDIVLLAKIRDLLYVDMYTIAGARRQLELPDAEKSVEMAPQQQSVDVSAYQEELDALQTALAALEQSHEELQSTHAELQSLHQAVLAERGTSDSQLQLAYENVCDERDVLAAQFDALQLENEALHLSVMPAESVAETEEKNRELFEVIARLESELRDAHRVSDELRAFKKDQQSQEEQRRRSALSAMRLELEKLAGLAGETFVD